MSKEENNKTKLAKAATVSAVGAGVGYGAIAASGLTAAGMVGGGAGIGTAAGPIGAAAGAVVGLAAFGVYRLFKKQNPK